MFFKDSQKVHGHLETAKAFSWTSQFRDEAKGMAVHQINLRKSAAYVNRKTCYGNQSRSRRLFDPKPTTASANLYSALSSSLADTGTVDVDGSGQQKEKVLINVMPSSKEQPRLPQRDM